MSEQNQKRCLSISDIGGRGAVVSNSGQPVAHSGPGVMQPTSPARAGRNPDARRPSSPHHAKSGSGFGGEAPDTKNDGEAVEQSSSLVPYKNNRYSRVPQGRGKYCARRTLKGIDLRSPRASLQRQTKYYRLNCNCWDCSYCGPIKAKRYKAAIRALAEAYRLNKFLTLTLDPKKLGEVDDPVRYLRKVFNDFRVYLHRRFKQTGQKLDYICVLEFHQGGGANHGVPHLHILLNQYIEQAWISRTWEAIGGGNRVWIEQVAINRASRYLSKYLTKELLLSAPKKSRRITSSRTIKLMPKFIGPKHYSWTLRKEPIQFFYELHSQISDGQMELFAIVDIHFDAEEFLEKFSVLEAYPTNSPTLTLGGPKSCQYYRVFYALMSWNSAQPRMANLILFAFPAAPNSLSVEKKGGKG